MIANDDIELLAIFIFYSKSNGVQAKLAFDKELRHCNIITNDGTDWILLEFDTTGFVTRRLAAGKAYSLVRGLRVVKDVSAIITVQVQKRLKQGWRPLLVRSCNEISRYAAGVDIGWTFNPVSLYKKLLKYDGRRNYTVLNAWRRGHGVIRQYTGHFASRSIGRPADEAK